MGGAPAPATHRLDELLERARARIERLSPDEAQAAASAGALVVDIRSDADREHAGVVPGSLHVPRTVLEWRLAPDSPWRNPHVGGLDRRIVVICDHGYSSSLAAATLVDLGYRRAGDVVGGFEAWQASGLPIAPADAPPRPAGARRDGRSRAADRVDADRSAPRSRRSPTAPLTLPGAGHTLAVMSEYDAKLVSFERRLRELELELADLRRTAPAGDRDGRAAAAAGLRPAADAGRVDGAAGRRSGRSSSRRRARSSRRPRASRSTSRACSARARSR